MKNWKVFKGEATLPIATGVSADDAIQLVDFAIVCGWNCYAVDPNGNTYPANLHDDGDHDPAFS